MKAIVIPILLFLCTFTFENHLTAQSDQLTTEEKKYIEEACFGNIDFWKADNLYAKGSMEEARTLYQKAIQSFEESKQWEAFIMCSRYYAMTYEGTPDYEKGITIIDKALEKIETLAPNYIKDCFKLHYQKGNFYALERQTELATKNAFERLHFLNKYFEEDSNENFVLTYNGISYSYRDLMNYDSAIYYSKKAIDVCLKLPEESHYLAGHSHLDIASLQN